MDKKYGLEVSVTTRDCLISALRGVNDKNSSKITISPEIIYQHIWQGDVIRGPGSCDLLVDATLNGISFLDSKGKGRMHLVYSINSMLTSPKTIVCNRYHRLTDYSRKGGVETE